MSENNKKQQGLIVVGTVVSTKPTKIGGSMVTFSIDHSLVTVFFRKEEQSKIPALYDQGQFQLSCGDKGFLGLLQ